MLLLMVLLPLALLTAAPALGSTVTLTQDHSFSITFVGGDLTPTTQSADVLGSAEGTTSVYSTASSIANPATASLGSLTYLPTTTATTDGTNLTMSQNLVANAPDLLGGAFYQNALNGLSLSLTAPLDGAYGYFITDNYSQNFSLANGGPFGFTQLYGYSNLYLAMTDVNQGISTTQTYNFLTSENDNLDGSLLASFLFSQATSQDFSDFMSGIVAGDTLTLDITLDSTQYGTSAVPLPSTLLLLGSGLGGLLLAGRRRVRS